MRNTINPYERVTKEVVVSDVMFRVSNFGNVWRYNSKKGMYGDESKKKMAKKGATVAINVNRRIRVDVLVAMAFLNYNPAGDEKIVHLNLDKTCYYLDNLKLIDKNDTLMHPKLTCKEHGISYSTKYKKFAVYGTDDNGARIIVKYCSTLNAAIYERDQN